MPSQVFVGNIPADVTEQQLHDLFSSSGSGSGGGGGVIECIHRPHGKSFAFIEFTSFDRASHVVQHRDSYSHRLGSSGGSGGSAEGGEGGDGCLAIGWAKGKSRENPQKVGVSFLDTHGQVS